jgi:rare lipoprotein A
LCHQHPIPDMKHCVKLSVFCMLALTFSSFGQANVKTKTSKVKSTKLVSSTASKTNKLVGKASFYSNYYVGRKTAKGAKYDPALFTAAHETLPLGKKLRVRNVSNGKYVTVTVNDRCNCSKHGRIIDLSYAAAQQLNFVQKGVTKVAITVL